MACLLDDKTSLQLVFSWSLRVIIVKFSPGSNLDLGGDECGLYLLHHHLGFSEFLFINYFGGF